MNHRLRLTLQVVPKVRPGQGRFVGDSGVKLNLAIKALTGVTARLGRPPGQRSKSKFSKAGLARIAAAQRKRWAKIKAAQKK